jgi:hypothetical protein
MGDAQLMAAAQAPQGQIEQPYYVNPHFHIDLDRENTHSIEDTKELRTSFV